MGSLGSVLELDERVAAVRVAVNETLELVVRTFAWYRLVVPGFLRILPNWR